MKSSTVLPNCVGSCGNGARCSSHLNNPVFSKQLIKEVGKGLLTRVPGWQRLSGKKSGGSTASAEYCYAVWLKHIALLQAQGLQAVPKSMAEIGPGNSLGVGLAAMLCGVEHYTALDVMSYASNETDLDVLDELLEMFQRRAPNPVKGWPDFDEHLDAQGFPSAILTDEALDASLAPERITELRRAVRGQNAANVSISYRAPWMDASVIEPGTIDLIISHSVLEHVQDIPTTYDALYRWLAPGGRMSHQIDFTAHALSPAWDGYRAYPEWLWSLIMGKRPYLINRAPLSHHVQHIQRCGFKIICDYKLMRDDVLQRSRLSSRFNVLSDEDRGCSSTFIQAKKDSSEEMTHQTQDDP
jgi:hypothetical protein